MKLTRRDFIKSIAYAMAGFMITGFEQPETPKETCGRCGKKITADDAEYCHWCIGYLCYECWDEYGHCGHPEAEAQNERARQATQEQFMIDVEVPPSQFEIGESVQYKISALENAPVYWHTVCSTATDPIKRRVYMHDGKDEQGAVMELFGLPVVEVDVPGDEMVVWKFTKCFDVRPLEDDTIIDVSVPELFASATQEQINKLAKG